TSGNVPSTNDCKTVSVGQFSTRSPCRGIDRIRSVPRGGAGRPRRAGGAGSRGEVEQAAEFRLQPLPDAAAGEVNGVSRKAELLGRVLDGLPVHGSPPPRLPRLGFKLGPE